MRYNKYNLINQFTKGISEMTTTHTPSINEFAKTVADAYVNQYHGGSRVMGTPIVYYNTETGKFDWCSNQTPLADNEIKCETVEDGLYGDTSVGDHGDSI